MRIRNYELRIKNDSAWIVGWFVCAVIAVGLMSYGWALGAENTHPGWSAPNILDSRLRGNDSLGVSDRYDARLKEIIKLLERQIKQTQPYTDSTLEVVDYGTVKLVNGQLGVRLRRSYGSGYFGLGFDRGQTYVESGLTVTHRIGIVPIDADSIVVRAYKATGEIATNDTSTVGYLVWKADR